MKISRKYAEHRAELSAILGYIADENGAPSPAAVRLGISAEEIGGLAALRAAFETAFAAYRSPETHTPIAVREMRVADEAAFAAAAALRRRLKNGRAVLLPEDYGNLGIHQDKKTRTRAKTPAETPALLLINSAPLSLTFEAVEIVDGGRRTALPRGWRIAREMAVLPQGAELAEGDFRALNSVGRCRFAVGFAAGQIEMEAYLRAAYENTAGRGPWSQTVKAVVI